MNAPFNAVATPYDDWFTNSPTGRLQRDVVWRVLEGLVPEGAQLNMLELNGGTGEDALWLARRGCRVLLTDASDGMLDVARQKVKGEDVDMDIRVLQFEELDNLPENNFDLILSNFGGLNCLSPKAMRDFGRAVAQKLRPGGHFVAVVMGRFCWWETLYFVLKGRFKSAFRRLGNGPLPVHLDENTRVDTWYYAARSFHIFFPKLQQTQLQAVGFWLPPSYLDPFFRRFPKTLNMLNRLEKFSRRPLFSGGADHFVVVLRA
jgi:ubiquinone/menaquinone biosynthesis C-methylase UbiE